MTIGGRTVKPTGLMTMSGQPLIDGLLAPVGHQRCSASLELFARWFDLSFLPSRLAALHGSQ